MIKKLTLSCVLLFSGALAYLHAQGDVRAYALYSKSGKELKFSEVVKFSEQQQVVFFGELHNNPICHWLQLELAVALGASKPLTLGAEMFETDDQLVLNEYTGSLLTKDQLMKETKVWPNFETDYLPLVDYAKDNRLKFVATNVPRRYASIVSKNGQSALLSLSPEALVCLPSLPYKVTDNDRGYGEMLEMMGAHGHGMSPQNFIEAQALKDYTMATNILAHLDQDGVFLHFNGSFHTQYRAGIVGYLLAAEPQFKTLVISTVEADSFDFQDEWSELGDIILVVTSKMTKTH